MAGINTSDGIKEAKANLQRFLRHVEGVTTQEMESLRIKVETQAKIEAPFKTGKLEESITVRVSRSKSKRGLNVRALARNPKTGYNYALIQHENMAYKHTKGKSHFIEDPFNREVKKFQDRVRRRLKKNG